MLKKPSNNRGIVLVVEDEELIRKLVVRVLTNDGYKVLEAADPIEACTLFRYQVVDLLLTDIIMPHNSGTDLAAALALRRPQLKVLFSTAQERPDHLPPSSGFIQKPYSSQQLRDAVKVSFQPDPEPDDPPIVGIDVRRF